MKSSGLGYLAPAAVDGQGVPPAGDLGELGRARVALLPLGLPAAGVIGRGD